MYLFNLTNMDITKQVPVFLKKNKKPIIIAGGVLVGLILLLTIVKAKKSKSDTDTPEAKGTGISWPLKRKAGILTTDDEVVQIKRLQRYLNRKISYVDPKLVIDGYFGTETEKQVQLFLGTNQVSYKLFHEIIMPYDI